MYIEHKKSKDSARRDLRFKRRREEEKNPRLGEERRARNIPATIDSKRKFDEIVGGDEDDILNRAVDVLNIKRLKQDQETEENGEGLLEKLKQRDQEDEEVDWDDEEEDEMDSMLASDTEDDASSSEAEISKSERNPQPRARAASPAASTATNLELTPEFLKQKFPSIFNPPEKPKILITSSLNSTLHHECELLTSVFPNSTYVRRSAHAHAHKYSVREIAQFASNRGYTALVIVMEDMKKPTGLDIVHLPAGPHVSRFFLL